MKKLKEYVARLQKELRFLPEREKADLWAEIESHLVDGLEDEALGQTPAEREAALVREMGQPELLGGHMQQIHQSSDRKGLALALLPLLLIGTFDIYTVAGYLGALAVCFLLIWAARSYRSYRLLGWWAAVASIVCISGLSLGIPGSMRYWFAGPLWAAVLLGAPPLTIWLYGRFLWRHRTNRIVVMTTLTPLVWYYIMMFQVPMTVENYILPFLGGMFVATTFTLFIAPNRRVQWVAFISVTGITFVGSAVLFAFSSFLLVLLIPFAVIAALSLVSKAGLRQVLDKQ